MSEKQLPTHDAIRAAEDRNEHRLILFAAGMAWFVATAMFLVGAWGLELTGWHFALASSLPTFVIWGGYGIGLLLRLPWLDKHFHF